MVQQVIHEHDGEDAQRFAVANEDLQSSSKKRKLADKDDNHDIDGPACQNCRKKKSACSRTQPCRSCEKYSTFSCATSGTVALG